MAGMRVAEAVDDLVGPNAVCAALVPGSDNEVWMFRRGAGVDAIVDECNVLLDGLNERCAAYRRQSRRRSAVLAAAALALGFALGRAY